MRLLRDILMLKNYENKGEKYDPKTDPFLHSKGTNEPAAARMKGLQEPAPVPRKRRKQKGRKPKDG